MREIVFEVPREQVEAWSDALLEAGAVAVQAEDADADSPDEQPLFGEPGHAPREVAWQRTRLAAMVADHAACDALLAEASGAVGCATPTDYALRDVLEQDWVQATQAQFEPIPVGQRLLITPSWHLAEPRADREAHAPERITIEMDPGLAFGTGSHPTTRLCLEWLDTNLRSGAGVIDYGCGSGILGIAAARLGARGVVAIDIDPQALAATRDNAQRNGVSIDVRAAGSALPEPSDVVLANILSNPLKLLAPMLSSLVAPGGSLVLSGVLVRQAAEVAACYPPGLRMRMAAERDGWACLVGTRSSEAW